MKRLSFFVMFIALAMTMAIGTTSCEQSEGEKFGTLQKVSHKTPWTCSDWYECQVAYEGGVATEKGGFSNVQDFEITKVQYDSMKARVGDKIVFEYHDVGYVMCGNRYRINSFRFK